MIITLQNHFGMVIRQNTDNLYATWKAVAAVLYHSTNDPDSEKRHSFCPRRPDAWCKCQKDKITGEETYKKKTLILLFVNSQHQYFRTSTLAVRLICLNACMVKLKTSTNPSTTLYGHGVRKGCMLGITHSRLLLSLL